MSTPVIVTAAIVGAEVTRAQTPYLPITPKEIALEARRCREAGAAVVHLHVRNDDGTPTQSRARFQDTVHAIRDMSDVLIQVSTGGAIGMSEDERLESLDCQPDMATLNCGTMNFGNDVFANPWPMICHFAERMRAKRILPELEIYDLGHLAAAKRLAREKFIREPVHVQFVLGVAGGAPADEATLRFLRDQLPVGWQWSVAAVGRFQKPMTELGLQLGGHVRVGLEDNIYLSKGVLSAGSAPLVEQVVKSAAAFGRRPVEPEEARNLLRETSSP